jgi:hypothetical protein
MITKITSYIHAGHLFDIANRAAGEKNSDSDSPLIAMMFSVLALEAFINESGVLAQMVPTSERQQLIEGFSSVMKELEERKESLLIKYHMGLLVFTGSTWDEGALPFQDFKLLIAIRNSIVHMKADKWDVKVRHDKSDPERDIKQYPKFIGMLQRRGIIDMPAESTSWLKIVTQPKVAKWACATAVSITKGFFDAVPEGYYKKSLSGHVLTINKKG